MSFMELLCDASYNERKNTVTFPNLKAKKKRRKRLLSQFYITVSTDINGIILIYFLLYVRGESGLLTASAVILKYRRRHSLCWICSLGFLFSPLYLFLFSLKNYQELFNF